MRATKHFEYDLLDPQRKDKKIKLYIYTGKLPTSKKKK